MEAAQDWVEAYKELCAIINNEADPAKGVEEVGHIDLWHEQIDFLPEEYPWPSGSLFINFNAVGIETTGKKVQDMNFEISFILVLDTLSDTYNKSDTQEIALAFGLIMRKIHKLLQAKYGANFGPLNRVRFRRIPAPQYLIAYEQTYTSLIRDMSAMDEPAQANLTGSTVKKGFVKPATNEDIKLYNIG